MRRLFALAVLSAFAVPAAAFALTSSPQTPPSRGPMRHAIVWSPAPWIPPGFETLDRLLRAGHAYRSMGWL